MNIRKVAVIGSGTMGSGIAAQLCNANVPVTLLDLKTEISEKARERIYASKPPLLLDKLKINNINDTHTFTIVLKGKGQKVFISIGEIKFSIISKKNWSEFKKNIKFKSTNSSKKLSISILDKEIYIANCSLMPKDTIFGFRKDISEMIKKWRPSYIRWPGGNFLSGYNWKNGIGNKNYRLPYYDFAWYSWENNDVGTDEFMQWCEYIGSEPMITVNTGNGTVEEATSWIEYCTGDNKTKYGKLRIFNGRKGTFEGAIIWGRDTKKNLIKGTSLNAFRLRRTISVCITCLTLSRGSI